MQKFYDPYVLLEWARDIAKSAPFIDFHVHPFDVLTGDTEYKLDTQIEGLNCKGSSVYHPPKVQSNLEYPTFYSSRSMTLNSLFLTSRLAYTCTGPKVIIDQLDEAGLMCALLLPVARIPGAAENLTQVAANMFPNDGRLFLGCAFPVGIPPEELDPFFRSVYKTKGIRAIKLHPNLTGIDPLTGFGTDLIEAMLATAGSLEIPVVTHGGRTLALEPVAYREYGTLTHLVNVNWSVSSSPVIIAHCGLCCLSEEEAITTLDVLNRLFERYPNLMADISNLEPQILRLVMENVDHNRLIFGSDALYIPIWKSWVRFLHSLRLISQNPDDDLIRIASLNPIHCLKLQHMHDTLSFNN